MRRLSGSFPDRQAAARRRTAELAPTPGKTVPGTGRAALRRRFKPRPGTEAAEAAGTRRLRTAGRLSK